MARNRVESIQIPANLIPVVGVMYVIGTAGHVDHGKSTLVKALTDIDPDRLPEEKAREMTVDLGFAWLTLPSGREVSIVDVPGHERFIKNMLAGVGGIDLALLIVAADESVMPQTREHLAILDILQIRRGIVVVTKTDLVDEELVELVKAEVEDTLVGTSFEGCPMVGVSAYTGDGIAELKAAMDEVLGYDGGAPRLGPAPVARGPQLFHIRLRHGGNGHLDRWELRRGAGSGAGQLGTAGQGSRLAEPPVKDRRSAARHPVGRQPVGPLPQRSAAGRGADVHALAADHPAAGRQGKDGKGRPPRTASQRGSNLPPVHQRDLRQGEASGRRPLGSGFRRLGTSTAVGTPPHGKRRLFRPAVRGRHPWRRAGSGPQPPPETPQVLSGGGGPVDDAG